MYTIKKKLGLYIASYLHYACGIEFVVSIEGKEKHKIVDDAIKMLENLSHRGASGVDSNSDDGAEITIQITHKFLSVNV